MKIVYIDTCHHCPYFDDEYYSYNSTCRELKRVIEHPSVIPDDCPLDDTVTD